MDDDDVDEFPQGFRPINKQTIYSTNVTNAQDFNFEAEKEWEEEEHDVVMSELPPVQLKGKPTRKRSSMICTELIMATNLKF